MSKGIGRLRKLLYIRIMKRKTCKICGRKRIEAKMVQKFGSWFCDVFEWPSTSTCGNHLDVKKVEQIILQIKDLEKLKTIFPPNLRV